MLSEKEIKILEEGLDSIQRKINEPKLRNNFEEFCRRMQIKWYFRNKPSQNLVTYHCLDQCHFGNLRKDIPI